MRSIVSLDDFRKNLSDIVGRVMYGNQTVLVQKHNRPGVGVISEKEWMSLRAPRKRFTSQKDWDKLFVLADKVRGRISVKDREELEHVVDQEIKIVRQSQGTA